MWSLLLYLKLRYCWPISLYVQKHKIKKNVNFQHICKIYFLYLSIDKDGLMYSYQNNRLLQTCYRIFLRSKDIFNLNRIKETNLMYRESPLIKTHCYEIFCISFWAMKMFIVLSYVFESQKSCDSKLHQIRRAFEDRLFKMFSKFKLVKFYLI